MIIKKSPEDFIVEELPVKEWDDAGHYAVFKLIKTNLNTERAIEIISGKFHVSRSIIKYAGSKDRHAITTQYISIPSKNIVVSKICMDDEDLKLSHVGYTDEPLSLGSLKGNRFVITARELTPKESSNIKSKNIRDTNNDETHIIPNYFDDQRFSINNYNIGLNILKRNYKKAVEFMCESSSIYKDATDIYILSNPNDYIGALKHIPKKTLLMLIHSVQSYIYNEALTKILIEYAERNSIEYYIVEYSMGRLIFYRDISNYEKCGIENLELLGFDTKTVNHYVNNIIKELGLTQRDFIVRAIPDLSVEGTTRECFVNVENLEIISMNERTILEFELPKGSYATMVLKALFN
jgi:tRNA pseudouridine13 synthase